MPPAPRLRPVVRVLPQGCGSFFASPESTNLDARSSVATESTFVNILRSNGAWLSSPGVHLQDRPPQTAPPRVRVMERHRPSAARTRDRSLRPPRGAATALATVLALLLLPGTAAGASGSSPAPAPPPVDSALTTAQAELATLLAQIKDAAAQQADLQGRVIAWSDAYTAASDRVERLLLRRQAVT